MSDNSTDVSDETGTEQKQTESRPEFNPITSQEEFDKAISTRIARERAKYADYDEVKSKAAQLDEVENAKKDELQRATERAEAAERRAAEHEAQILRRDVAAAKGLPANLAARLTGSTKDELEADADALAEMFKPASSGPKPNPQQGRPTDGREKSLSAGRALYEARHGKTN